MGVDGSNPRYQKQLPSPDNTLYTMGLVPQPNMTILWSEKLPLNFKKFAAKVSIDTSLQYENDDLCVRTSTTTTTLLLCCVSPMIVGKANAVLRARANLGE
ncbi:pyruvate formate lyase family protein [Shigella flexneri]